MPNEEEIRESRTIFYESFTLKTYLESKNNSQRIRKRKLCKENTYLLIQTAIARTARGRSAVSNTTVANCSRIPIRILITLAFPRMRILIHLCATPRSYVEGSLDSGSQPYERWRRALSSKNRFRDSVACSRRLTSKFASARRNGECRGCLRWLTRQITWESGSSAESPREIPIKGISEFVFPLYRDRGFDSFRAAAAMERRVSVVLRWRKLRRKQISVPRSRQHYGEVK